MTRRTNEARPVHVFLDVQPPAELVAAARRGECIVAQLAGPIDKKRWHEAFWRFAEAIERRAENVLAEEDAAATAPRS